MASSTVSLASPYGYAKWRTFKPLAPNFGKLNPLAGLGRMVSGQHLGDLAKACFLALVLGVVGGLWLWLHLGRFHDALAMPLPAALAHTGLLVNTTSLGMVGHPPLVLDLFDLARDAAVAEAGVRTGAVLRGA